MKLQYKASLLIFAFGSVCLITISLIYYFLASASDLKSLHFSFQETVKKEAEHLNIILGEEANEAVILSSAPTVIESLTRSNADFASMSEDEKKVKITELNDRWMKTKDASDPFIRSYMTNPSARFFEEYSERYPGEYGELFLTNRYGALVATTGKLTTLSHAHKYWWKAGYAGGKGRIFFDDRGFDISAKTHVLGVVTPVMKNGEVIGIFKSNVNITDMLQKIVGGFHYEDTKNLKIVRSGGAVLLEKNKEPLSTKAPLSLVEKMRTRTAGSFVFEDPEKPTINAYAPVQLTLGSSKYGFGGKSESIDHIRGNKGELWFVVMSQGLEEALAPSYRRMKELLSIGALLITLIGILAIFLGKRVALPVIRMEKSIKRIGDGDFDVKIDIHSDDELGRLEESFNKMAENLKNTTTSRDELQAEVKSRRQAEKTLKEERNKLSAIVGAMEVGLTIQNPDYDIIYQNKLVSDTFGRLGEKCYKVYEGKDSVCDGCPVEMAYKDGKSYTSERKVTMPSGEIAYWENTANPIKDADGNIVSCLEIGRNITQRKRSEEVLRESEEKFRSSFHHASVGMARVSLEGRFLEVNGSICEILGYSQEDLMGMTIRDITHPDDIKDNLDHRLSVLEGKAGSFKMQKRYIHKSGRIIWAFLNSSIVRDSNGNPMYFIGQLMDITKYKYAEGALKESEKRFQDVAANTGDWIWECNKEGRYTYSNKTVEKVMGYKPEEIVGKYFYDFLLPKERDLITNNVFKAYSLNKSFANVLNRKIHKNGNIIITETNGIPIVDEDGNLIGYRGAVRDITERKSAERALQEGSRLLEESQRVAKLGSYTFNVSSGMWSSSEILDEIFGIRDKAFIKDVEGWLQIVHPEQREEIQSHLMNHVLAKRNKFDKEYRIIRLDDEQERWVHGLGELVLDENQNPVKMIGTIQDITERKKAEEALKESEERFRSVAQSANDAIISASSDGKIISWNDGAQKIFGYGEEETLGKPLTVLMPGRYRAEHNKGFNHATSNGKNKIIGKTVEFNGLKKDGSEFPMELSIASWDTDKGKFFSAIIRDISERKILQQQLIQSEKLSSIGTFISGIAHEINNPLGIILGYSQLLSDYAKLSKNDIEDYVDIIIKQSKKTAKIVKTLLKYTRKGNKERTPVNINDILEEIVHFHILHFKNKKIEIKSEYDTSVNLVNADESLLQQVFTNIIMNAIDSLKQTGIKGNITIRTEQREKEVVVAIENQGAPIPEDMLCKIFDPFFTTKEVGKGTGLGLYISSGIVQEHGGKLWVENIPGFGVRFVVALPIVEEKISQVEVSISPKTPKILKVLFVDDEEPLRKLVKVYLEKEGMFLQFSENGNEAVKIINANEFDVIISDIKMPQMDGYELCRWIMENKPDYMERFVLVTGLIDSEVDEFCSKYHVKYINKPFDKIELLEIIGTITNKSNLGGNDALMR